jgi:hypothetical protein
MESLHRTKSSSNPDLLSLLSSSHQQPLKRTNSTTDIHSITDAPAPLHSVPSFSIYADDQSPNKPDQEPYTSINHDFTFDSECDPKSTDNRDNCGDNAVPLFLARGLGIDRVGSELLDIAELLKGKCPISNGRGQHNSKVEMELKKIVEEEPNNAKALKEYAQFLHQVRDMHNFFLLLNLCKEVKALVKH